MHKTVGELYEDMSCEEFDGWMLYFTWKGEQQKKAEKKQNGKQSGKRSITL